MDGLSSYVTAFTRVVRNKVQGPRGRPRRVVEEGRLLGQVVKRRQGRRVVEVLRRAVRGSLEAIGAVLARTGTGLGINTAYLERLNATFRGRLPGLGRRGRAWLHDPGRLGRWRYLVGGLYNFCWEHDSLRVAMGEAGRKWQGRTPAMAAGLTDHRWGVEEVRATALPPAV